MIDLAISVLALSQQNKGGTELPLRLTMYQTWAEIIWRGATVLAILAGGLFTYWKFWRGREFVNRVNPALPVIVASHEGGTIYIRATATAKNIGLSKIEIDHPPTCIKVELRERGAAHFKKWGGKWPVFETQDILESNEELGDSVTIVLPDGDYPEAKLHLNFFRTAYNPWWRWLRPWRWWRASNDGRYWCVTKVVDLAESADNQGH